MQPHRVLIADDNDALRRVMMSYLHRHGYEVVGARDGHEALRLLQTHEPFDVLVTDLDLPELTGLELMHAARKLKSPPEVVVVTATATLESAITAIHEGGISDYLFKPLERIGELFMAVTQAATSHRLRLEQETFQNRLAVEAERLRALIAHTGDAILSADSANVLRVVNPAAARLIGRDDLEGSEAHASLPSPLATLLANWQEAGNQHPLIVEVPWPTGALQTVNLAPIAGSDGSRNGWVMVVRDITHLKRQDELRLQLLKAIANKIQFPLARAIFTLAELKDVAENHSVKAAETYQRLVKLWGQVQEWEDGLLNLVQLESGDGLQLIAVDVTTLVDEVRRGLVEELMPDKQLTFFMNLWPAVSPVRADPDVLRQLLRGLIYRAALRSAVGGEITLTTQEQQGHVWIEISDDGPPLTETDLPHVLEEELSRSSADANHFGLDLALAKSIVDQMSGQIWVGRPRGKGSTLTLCLLAIARAEAG